MKCCNGLTYLSRVSSSFNYDYVTQRQLTDLRGEKCDNVFAILHPLAGAVFFRLLLSCPQHCLLIAYL